MRTTTETDLLEEVRRIGPALQANAALSDREGRLPKSSLDAMRDLGLLRLYVPRSLGGLEIDPVMHTRVQEELARYDTAAAWVLQVASPGAWFASRLPTQTVEEIFGSSPDQIMSTSFGVPVEATAADGGFVLSAQRSLASFVSESSWIWLTALNMIDGQPEAVDGSPVVRACFFPATEAKVVHTWDTLGMRGTDSNDVLVDNLFVPEHRTFRIGIDHTPGPLFEGPLYRMAVMAAASTWLPAVALGVAREAIDEVVELSRGKTPFSSATTLRDRGVVQSKVGRAEGVLRSARAYLYERIAHAWDHAVASGGLTLEEKTEVLLAAVQAISASVQAVDLMYSVSGTTGIYKRNRLERLHRDAQVLRQHGFVSESRFETVGQVWMGLAPELGFVAL
ncbi:MAG: acyl-CoA dehydrogenase family protein [Actinomycetota bacterium]